MTATPILDALAREFDVQREHVQNALEMLDAGLCAPFIGRFRRGMVGGLTETPIRRLDLMRRELAELDRRRATILAILERDPNVPPSALAAVRSCMDRFELEDLFVPHRRPEPEVQLALDRGLGALADLLVAPVPEAERAPESKEADTHDEDDDDPAAEAPADEPATAHVEPAPVADSPADPATPSPAAEMPASESMTASIAESAPEPLPEHAPEVASEAAPDPAAVSPEDSEEDEPPAPAPEPVHHAAIDVRTAMNLHLARLCQPFVRPDKGIHTDAEALSGALRILSDRLGRHARLRGTVRRLLGKHGVLGVRATIDESRLARHRSLLRVKQPLRQLQGHRLLAIRQAQKERVLNTVITLDPQIALPKVRAVLGKHTHPAHEELLREVALQALNQRLIPVVEQDVRLELKERADAEALRFLSQHLRQILLAPPFGPYPVAGIDVNAKGDWIVAVVGADGEPIGPEIKIEMRGERTVERTIVVPVVAPAPPAEAAAPAATGPDGAPAPEAVAATPPMDSAPAAPPATPPVAATQTRTETRTEHFDKDVAALGAELRAILEPADARAIAVGHGKGPRNVVPKIRAALRAACPDLAPGSEPFVFVVNEAGLSSYANSELARNELRDRSIPARMAISLARRLQDPMAEMLKVDPRHLGLGSEQGLVSKANARRTFAETIESCTAHVGCDVNRAPLSFLEHVPGIGRAAARRIVERRKQRPFASREELRARPEPDAPAAAATSAPDVDSAAGTQVTPPAMPAPISKSAEPLLTEAQWIGAISFLRVEGSAEPFDATSLHPEHYALVRRILDSAGTTVEQALGRPGATRGLRREDFDVDDGTWRDLLRELAWPGRDPRPRLGAPELLEAGTDPVRLVKDRVVEGVISNVASFGAFVDVGLAQDALVHISEISERYVRDARELLAIGQYVRARILDASGQRLTLSLRRVPPSYAERGGADRGAPRGGRGRSGRGPSDRFPRAHGVPGAEHAGAAVGDRSGPGSRDRGAGGDEGRGRRRGGHGRDREERTNLNVRAAQSRRDGLGVRSGGRRGGPGKRGGKPGESRGFGGRDDRGPRDEKLGPEERVRIQAINDPKKSAFSPFATFFKSRQGEPEAPEAREGAPNPSDT